MIFDCFQQQDFSDYHSFRSIYGGKTYENGVISVLTDADAAYWKDLILEYYPEFPEFRENLELFAFDWEGRGIAVDIQNEAHILYLDIGAAYVMEVDADFSTFIRKFIVEQPNDYLYLDMYQQWLALGNAPIKYGDCAGFIIPLFLSGKDEVENMEVSSLEVYWVIIGQIKVQIM